MEVRTNKAVAGILRGRIHRSRALQSHPDHEVGQQAHGKACQDYQGFGETQGKHISLAYTNQ